MVTEYRDRQTIRDILLTASDPDATACAAALEAEGPPVLITRQHADNLAKTFRAKYETARDQGYVRVRGLEPLLEALERTGNGVVRGVVIQDGPKEFVVVLDQELRGVLGLMQIESSRRA